MADGASTTAQALSRKADCIPTTSHALSGLSRITCADQEMMVPLTESLYVSGHVHDKDHLLVEIGAGYYAEV